MAARHSSDPRFSVLLRQLIDRRGTTFRALAAHTYYSKSYLHDLAAGKKPPSLDVAQALDKALGTGGELTALLTASRADTDLVGHELALRVAASDVSAETLLWLEQSFDDLAMLYTTTPPVDLLPQVRQRLADVSRLLEVRKTLDQHRRLLVVGGWLSLLAATIHIDLRQPSQAHMLLATSTQMAEHAQEQEIRAWCVETHAWEVLTDGQYPEAVRLAQLAQALAPRGSSAHIQATAQEGRAWARMHRRPETRSALERVGRLVTSLPVPDRPEHHYRYDPEKALSYTATTLAWAGDPAAEDHARAVILQLEQASRPRRVASARLDLALALLAADKPDEASATAIEAISSGRVVPSNWWRATEVVVAVGLAGIHEARDLRDVYEVHRPH